MTARTIPTTRPISTRFAASVVLAAGDATARDMAHLVTLLSGLATMPGIRDDLLMYGEAADPFPPARYAVDDLMAITGLSRPAHLAAIHDRLFDTKLSFLFERGGPVVARPRYQATSGWRSQTDERRAPRPGEIALVGIHGILAAVAHLDADRKPKPITVDVGSMRGFSCRHSAIAYMRALAWLSGPFRVRSEWEFTSHGGTARVVVPADEACDAIGCPPLPQASRITEKILKPISADLATVGMDLAFRWIAAPGKVRVQDALELVVKRL